MLEPRDDYSQEQYEEIADLVGKWSSFDFDKTDAYIYFDDLEKELVMNLSNLKEVVSKAAETLSPALVANYIYDLVVLVHISYVKVIQKLIKFFECNVPHFCVI